MFAEQHHGAAWIGEIDIGRIEENLGADLEEILAGGQAGVDDTVPALAAVGRRNRYGLEAMIGIQNKE